MKTSEYQPQEALRVAIMGAPKVGKTWLAGTFPKPAFIDTDYGIATVCSNGYRKAYPQEILFEQFEEDDLDAFGIFQKATAMKRIQDQVNAWAKDDNVKTIVTDSLTSLGVLASNMGLEVGMAMGRSKALVQGRQRGLVLRGMQDFGAEMAAIEQYMNGLQKVAKIAKKHIVVICHEREATSDSGAIVRLDPLITGAGPRAQFARWFDEVWYLDVQKRKINGQYVDTRVLITQPTAQIKVVGSRLGVPEMENPDFDKIFATIQSRRTGAATPSTTNGR